MVTRGRDRLIEQISIQRTRSRYMRMKSSHQCVIVTEMLSDILSMFIYRLSDSTDICVSAGCQALLAEMVWLQAAVLYMYIRCASGGMISSLLIFGIRIQ